MKKTKIIAEIANAHQGKETDLKALIQAAAENGADGVKFQWFKYNHIAVPEYFAYKSYVDLFIDEKIWTESVQIAKSLGLEVWVDVYDSWGISLLYKLQDFIDGIKLPTTVFQSKELIKALQNLQKKVLIGVGGWYEYEIDRMLEMVKKDFVSEIVLMHGFQGYPTKTEDVNLQRISYLKNRYNLEVGFADHEDADNPLAIELPTYAFFAGATVIEKHITLNRAHKGYDYFSALEPEEFKAMVNKIRQAEVAMGNIEIKKSERKYLENASLKVVANKVITEGEIVTSKKVSYKRCTNDKALMPMEAEELLPKIALTTIQENQPITTEMIKKPIITLTVICRLKSTRLPKKALIPINGIPSIERCLLNCLAIPEVDHVVLATSHLPEDDPLEKFTMEGKVKVVRGDPDNVAMRMIIAAESTNANIVIRVTGDNPAVSPEIISHLIQHHLKSGADCSISQRSPMGTTGDIITVEALHRLINQPKQLTHTEYLSLYFINNPAIFSVNNVELPPEFHYPSWRLTLDEPKDLEMFEELYKNLNIKREPLFFHHLKSYILDNPKIIQINKNVSVKWIDQKSLVEEINRATFLK